MIVCYLDVAHCNFAIRASFIHTSTGLAIYRTAVLNLLRFADHLQIFSLGRGPPLTIVPWKIAKIGLFVCLYPCKLKKLPLLADHQVDVVGHGGALVEATRFDRRVVGSNPALAAM